MKLFKHDLLLVLTIINWLLHLASIVSLRNVFGGSGQRTLIVMKETRFLYQLFRTIQSEIDKLR